MRLLSVLLGMFFALSVSNVHAAAKSKRPAAGTAAKCAAEVDKPVEKTIEQAMHEHFPELSEQITNIFSKESSVMHNAVAQVAFRDEGVQWVLRNTNFFITLKLREKELNKTLFARGEDPSSVEVVLDPDGPRKDTKRLSPTVEQTLKTMLLVLTLSTPKHVHSEIIHFFNNHFMQPYPLLNKYYEKALRVLAAHKRDPEKDIYELWTATSPYIPHSGKGSSTVQ